MARRNSTQRDHTVASGQGRRTERVHSGSFKGKGTKSVVRPIGQPTKLTPNTEATLIGYFIQGATNKVACQLSGVGLSTFYRWMQRGEDARETLDQTGSLPEEEEVYRDFRESVLDAQAQASMLMTGVVFKAAVGGIVTSRRPVQNVDGVLQYGPDGELLWEETVTPPDGRLAMQYLQRREASDWSQQAVNANVKVEHSGPGGGPVQIEHTTQQVTDLRDRIMQVRQEMESDDAILERAERGEDGAYDVSSMDDGGE